jgi:hypothetical protein
MTIIDSGQHGIAEYFHYILKIDAVIPYVFTVFYFILDEFHLLYRTVFYIGHLSRYSMCF